MKRVTFKAYPFPCVGEAWRCFAGNRVGNYVKDVFLMIGNFLYPSQINSGLAQQILLYPDKQFSKYKNSN
jgi:hypothetical protein